MNKIGFEENLFNKKIEREHLFQVFDDSLKFCSPNSFRNKEIIRKFFGVNIEEQTTKELANFYDLTIERIRQIIEEYKDDIRKNDLVKIAISKGYDLRYLIRNKKDVYK